MNPARDPDLHGPIVLALDAGTTSVRAIAFDRSGRALHAAQREFPQYYPRPGWVEHDPEEIWEACDAVMGEVVAGLHAPITAIGITDQRETVVVWDRRTGRPLHRAIVWQDRRTAGRCDELREQGHLETVRETTGLVLDPYFSATKLEWLFGKGGVRPGPEVAFGTVDSWLLWKLTGGAVHATDVTNASRTMLFDIRSRRWSPELCELFGVPAHVLPEVRASSGRFGITADGCAVGPGIPVSGVAGDQQAALFGQVCFTPGMTKNTYGTGSFVLMNVGEQCPPPVDGLLSTVAWSIPDGRGGELTHYAFEGAIFVTGAAIQWLRDGLGIISDASETGPLAASVPDTGGVLLVPAFTGLGSPWWDPYARGTLVGITRGTTRAHLARAVVEAMAYQTRDVVDSMTEACGHRVHALRADGGASVMPLLLRLQADQLQVPVSRPVVQETTALGAAYLAGLAEGVWGSLEEISANWVVDVEVEPSADRTDADAAYERWRQAVARARGWVAR
ncbi:glycerol kinase GlpK [Rhabdothermincola sediminis]|uniref:glycerol kinase GlpK n=1 Tax=Rhabdothermincola sediminis TaxID=2751370 RepID=UPI001AA08149|nr:glycerol kinase GlpK [Rhabdothermincola sediminis]